MSRKIMCHLLAIAIGIVLAIFIGLLFDRKPVLEISSLAIVPDHARSGDPVLITWKVRAYRNCDGIVLPRVVDSSGRIFEFDRVPTVYQDLQQLENRSFTKALVLPIAMHPGVARYESIIFRWCNSVQKYLWPMVESPAPLLFTIVN